MKHRQVSIEKTDAVNNDGHTIGLDIGATAVRAAILAQGTLDGRASATVHGIGKVDLAPGTVVNGVVQEPGELTAALKRLWHENKFDCHTVILGIANQQVLVRAMAVPDLSAQQRAKALPFQAREIVALPIDEVVLDFCQLGSADPKTNMVPGLLLATPRGPVLVAVNAVERAGLTVGRVDLSSFGLMRSIGDEHLAVEAIIDLGAQLTTIVIHDRGVPRLVRTLARGGQELTQQLADRMSTSLPEADREKCEVGLEGDDPAMTKMLTDAMRPLIAEIRTSVQYYRSTHEGAPITQMSLTGGGSALHGIADALEIQIGVPTRVVDPMQHIRNRLSSKYGRNGDIAHGLSAVAVGLAMGAAA